MAPNHDPRDVPRLPRLPAAMLRCMLSSAERDEVLADLESEYRARARARGRIAARVWVWRQALTSLPALARRAWWRGWSGFEARADRLHAGGSMLESWAMDVRYALRRLRTRPTYAGLAVLTLSLGVAGMAAVYGVARPLLLEPLPVRAEEEVVVFWAESAWSETEFVYLRPAMTGFEAVAAYWSQDVTLQMRDGPARLVRGMLASAELFDVLGVRPVIGAGFRAGDDRPGAEPVVVLSHSLWRDLGSDPSIVGKRIDVSGVTRTIVGVMPEGFWFPDPMTRLWLSEAMDPDADAGAYGLIGRMPGGRTIASMTAELDRITALLRERFDYVAGADKTQNPRLTPLREHLIGSVRPALLALLGAMAAVLSIACVNITALMLGQVDARGTELAVRAALGAGRQRLLQQLIVESLAIGILAGLVGALLASIGMRVLVAALPLGALASAVRVDWAVLWAAIAIAMAAATAVALAPGAAIARSDPQVMLTRSRSGGVGCRGGRVEAGLVVAQVALALLMIAGAVLLIRSVENRRAIDPGLELEGVAVIDVVMPRTTERARRPQVIRDIVEAVKVLPGVEFAAAAQRLPLRGAREYMGLLVEDQPQLERATTVMRVVTPDHFHAMGIRLRSGRGLLETDRIVDAAEGVVVINQALADLYFPGVDPVGRRIAFRRGRWDRIVGVVENVAEMELSPDPVPARYVLYEQAPFANLAQTIVIRVRPGQDAAAILEPARRAIQAAAPAVAVGELTTLESVFARAIGPALPVMSLLVLLGALGLVLGVVGVYGVVSHFVARRTRDWGIRMALGLAPRRVVALVVRQGGALLAAGIALGLIALLALARFLGSFLYGVGVADARSLIAATAILLAVGLAAALIPALRASRIDPASVLREQ